MTPTTPTAGPSSRRKSTLQAYHKEYGLEGRVRRRYFTVYGPRGVENHAVIAMIARAFLKQDPFEVWGDGTQIRNWTYIDDIVAGTIAAGEKIDDGTAVNLGTMERVKVIDAINMVMEFTGHKAKIKLLPKMPTGPLNRVADNSLAKKLTGWGTQGAVPAKGSSAPSIGITRRQWTARPSKRFSRRCSRSVKKFFA